MSHTLHHPTQTAMSGAAHVPALEFLTARMTTLIARFAAWRLRARSRKAVAGLSPEQLADVAIDASTVLPPRPVLEVEAGLMAKLMSMR